MLKDILNDVKGLFLILALPLGLWACTPTAREETGSYYLPQELKDCKIFHLKDTSGSGITVMRCPNSSTTTKTNGKYPKSAIAIEEGMTIRGPRQDVDRLQLPEHLDTVPPKLL